MKVLAAAVITLASLVTGVTATSAPAARAASIPAPVHHGTLRISGIPRDGATVTAAGLSWHVPRLPRGMSLLSFQVAYAWQSCDAAGQHCRTGADTTAAPFAARAYVPGQAEAAGGCGSPRPPPKSSRPNGCLSPSRSSAARSPR